MLTGFQAGVLRTLASHRSPQSHVAGGAALNRSRPRMTGDIDIFNDVAESVERTAEHDIEVLRAARFKVPPSEVDRRAGIVSCVVQLARDATRLEWVSDSAARFLTPVHDDLFGYRLSDPDLAVNKLLAAAGRSTARDLIDLAELDRSGFPLTALAWRRPARIPVTRQCSSSSGCFVIPVVSC